MDVLKHPGPDCRRTLIALLLMALTVPCWGGQNSGEYEVKAAFLYKFASFVEWPSAHTDSLSICVLGVDPFGDALERVVQGKTIGGRDFLVQRIRSSRDGGHCQILFIAGSEKSHLRATLEQLQAQAILTVSDIPGFCESGGMINLGLAANAKVTLEINQDATARTGLRVSFKLLNLAHLVHSTPQAGVRN